MYRAAATIGRHAVGILGYEAKNWQAPVTAPNVATVNGGMRANTVGSNGMRTKSDRLMKEALLVYRIIINEKELSKILTGKTFAGQKCCLADAVCPSRVGMRIIVAGSNVQSTNVQSTRSILNCNTVINLLLSGMMSWCKKELCS